MAAAPRTLALRNYKTFQHYKDRRPPWVKFHVDFLDDPDLTALSPATRLVAALLTLIASVKDNRIPESPAWLAAECNVSVRESRVALADLLAIRYLVPASDLASTDASNPASESAPDPLAPRGRPRARGETETETERKDTSGSEELNVMRSVLSIANTVLGHKWKLTDDRKRVMRARLREGYTEEQLIDVIGGVAADPWEGRCMSGNDDIVKTMRSAAQVDKFLELVAGRNGNHTGPAIGQPGFQPRSAAEQTEHQLLLRETTHAT